MVYKENFVVSLRCNGKILREQDGYVILPFGSEYNIYMKNLDSRDCVVGIWVDGEDVVGSNRIIIRANDTAELKGFKNDSRVINSFKFIKKTQEISDHRGDKIDDGIIRVEITYTQKIEWTTSKTYYDNWNHWPWYSYPIPYTWKTTDYKYPPQIYYSSSGDAGSGGNVNGAVSCSNTMQMQSSNVCSDSLEDGITVKGSDTKQDFSGAYIDTLESTSHVIILKLKGTTNSVEVEKPIYVKTKLVCEICGRKMRSSNKFCSNCGAKL